MAAGLIHSQSIIDLSAGGGAPADGLYFMSNEVPRATAVFTDDFRRGSWYLVDADHTSWQTVAPGWGGSIFANPITPAGAIRNLQSIGKRPLFATSDYVGTTGVITDTDRNMAYHNLSGAGSGGYSELYYRAYKFHVPANFYGASNPSADYVWGGQKSYTVNRFGDDAGIFWAGIGYNVGAGGSASTGTLMATNNHGSDIILHQNQSVDIDEVVGRWYFEEWHIKLNTVGSADGVFELWVNDGGATGDFSSQSPILRARHTNVDWGRVIGDTALMGNVWLENWSNAVAAGSFGEQFWANVHAATAGPIGFVQ